MSAQPLVSVITPVYNGAKFVTQAIDSVLAQTYPNVESIVVDDGSPDNAVQIIEQTYGNNPRVRLIRQDNAGTAAARNTGIRQARGELIALLDQDDHWLEHKLEKQVPLFADPDVGMVHSGGQAYDSLTGAITARFQPPQEMSMTDLIAHCNVSCASSIFRQSIWQDVGGFNERLRGTDDWMFWIETAKAGYRVVGLKEDLVRIRIHEANQGTHVLAGNKDAWVAVIQEVESWGNNDRAFLLAIEKAWGRLRRTVYHQRCLSSRSAWQRQHYLRAACLRLFAVCRYPKAVTHVMHRIAFRQGKA